MRNSVPPGLSARGARKGRGGVVEGKSERIAPGEYKEMSPAHRSDFCPVIVRIREKTRRRVMDSLSANGGNGNLSALVEELLTQWLKTHDGKPPAGKRTATRGK